MVLCAARPGREDADLTPPQQYPSAARLVDEPAQLPARMSEPEPEPEPEEYYSDKFSLTPYCYVRRTPYNVCSVAQGFAALE